MFASENVRNPSLNPIGPITYFLGRVPDAPPCTCPECSHQYRKVDEQHTWVYIYNGAMYNEEASAACAKMVQSINANRAFIQRELTLRGAAIAKRWKKTTVKNRESLLKSIAPNMYHRKWHEALISYEMRYGNWLIEARKHQNIHLLPYMSVENLKEDPSRLIKLLQLRAQYFPADLAVADNRRLSIGWTAGILQTTFNGCAIVMYGPQYGSLVPWIHDEVHRGDSVGFPRGQLILKAQSHLLSVLRGVIEVLINGLPDVESSISANPNLSALPSIGEGILYVDEAFSSCPTFNIEKLADISSNRFKSARDHLSQLQTDPAYMRRYVQLIQNSMYSQQHLAKSAFPMTTQDLDYEAWSIRHWSWISDEIAELKGIQGGFTDQISRGQSMPQKYENKLASLEALILHLLDIQSRHIQCGLPYRPGFQQSYNFSYYTVDGRNVVSHGFKRRSDDDREQSIANSEEFVRDPLHWCIMSLTTHPDAPGGWDKFRLLEFLDQHLSKATVEERARIDEPLLRKVSDLAAFNELLTLVRSHRPRALQQNMAELKTTGQGLAWRFMSKTVVKHELGNNRAFITNERTLQEVRLDYGTLGGQLRAFADQEEPKDTPGRAWVIKDAAQRKALGSFWDEYRQEHQKRLKDAGISRADIAEDLEFISADKDADFLAALAAERKEILANTPSGPSLVREPRARTQQARKGTNNRQEMHAHGVVEPVKAPPTLNNLLAKKDGSLEANVELQTEWGNTPIVSKLSEEIKVKIKTRGEASSIDEELADFNITTGDQPQIFSEKLPVKKAAFEIFNSLFARHGGSKGVLWDKFVGAMASVGFMSRRSGGSAVAFEPSSESKWYGQGSIVFHRPHPDSTIDPVMLNSIGKRMKKWFGWGSETFELDK